MSISVTDNFKIARNSHLSGEDYYAIAQLYLPIMGIDSFSLYSYLFTLKDGEQYSFKKIIDALNFHAPSFLDKSFSKLEALSLIEVYYHENKGYQLILKPPLSVVSFFSNTLLSSFLSTQIGEIECKKIKSDFTKTNPRGYKNLTKKFDEVFDIREDDIENIFSKIFKLKIKNPIQVENPNFDYIFFKMNFDSSFIDPKILDDEEFRQQILNISFTYQLNEEEMKEVIIDTMALDRDLKYSDISKNARNYFQKKNKNKKKRFVTKEADTFLNSVTDDDTFRFIETIENISPPELLQQLNGGIKPAVSEIKIIEDLMNNTNFPISVINIMILLVNDEKDGVIPNYNYFEKIANTWARANIKTPLDVINYINKQKKTETKTKYVRGKKEAKVPDWYNQYEKQLDNLPKTEDLSQEEIEKILAEAKSEY